MNNDNHEVIFNMISREDEVFKDKKQLLVLDLEVVVDLSDDSLVLFEAKDRLDILLIDDNEDALEENFISTALEIPEFIEEVSEEELARLTGTPVEDLGFSGEERN
jgi:hypothetical protein